MRAIAKYTWSPPEDERLRCAVHWYGTTGWAMHAQYVSSRTAKQCRERWFNHLSSRINTDAWSPQEQRLLFDLVEKWGTAWSRISKCFSGRTSNAVKNMYNKLHRLSSLSMGVVTNAGSHAAALAIHETHPPTRCFDDNTDDTGSSPQTQLCRIVDALDSPDSNVGGVTSMLPVTFEQCPDIDTTPNASTPNALDARGTRPWSPSCVFAS